MASALIVTSSRKGGSSLALNIRSHLRNLFPQITDVILLSTCSDYILNFFKNSNFTIKQLIPKAGQITDLFAWKEKLLEQLAPDIEVVLLCYAGVKPDECKDFEKWATDHGIRVDTCSLKRGARHVIESNSDDDPDLVCSSGVPKLVGMRKVSLREGSKGTKS